MGKFLVFFTFLSWIFFTSALSQLDYKASLQNIQRIDDHTYQFEVYIESTSNEFQLTSYQCSFEFHCNDMLGDNFTFSYIHSSSELNNKPVLSVQTTTTDGHRELTFASYAGSDFIGIEQKKVGTFTLTRNKDYDNNSFKIDWNFEGVNATILTGKDFINITDPQNFVSPFNLTEVEKNNKNNNITDFQLFQNYPNPFNPATVIKWHVPFSSHVTLKIYNILGKVVAVLVDEYLSQGLHKYKFNANSLASGVYFYRITATGGAANFVQTKKMILSK